MPQPTQGGSVLNGIIGLIGAIAGLVTAVSGLLGVIFLLKRGSPRERKSAARAVMDAITPPDTIEIIDALAEAGDTDD